MHIQFIAPLCYIRTLSAYAFEYNLCDFCNLWVILFFSIYQLNDELKHKDFRFEMSLVGKDTDGLHCINPAPYQAMAIGSRQAVRNDDDSDAEM